MNDCNLRSADELTEEQQIAYYRWLLTNAHRLEEIRNLKQAQVNGIRKIADEKQKTIQENLDYTVTLEKRVIEKRAEREVLSKMIQKMQSVSVELEEELKQLDPEVEQISKFCQEADANLEISHRKLAKCFEEIEVLKQENNMEINDHMFELNTIKIDVDHRSQSIDVTRDQLAKKNQEIEDEAKEKEKYQAMLQNYKPDELVLKLEEVNAEKAQKMAQLDMKTSELQKQHDEVKFMIEKCAELEEKVVKAKEAFNKANERNKIKNKEIENSNLLLRTSITKKISDETNKLDEANAADCNVLQALLKQNSELDRVIMELTNTIRVNKKEIDNVELEKKETEDRINEAKRKCAELTSEIENLPNLNKDKLELAMAQLNASKAALANVKASFIEKIRNLTGNPQILAEFIEGMDEIESDNESASESKDNSLDDSGSTGLSNTSSHFQPKKAEEFIGKKNEKIIQDMPQKIDDIINMLDMVKSNEALNKSKTKF